MSLVKKDDEMNNVLSKGTKLRGTQSKFQQRVAQAQREEVDPGTMPNRLGIMSDCSSSMNDPEYDKEERRKMIGSRIELLRTAFQAFVTYCNLDNTAICCETFPPRMDLELCANRSRIEGFVHSLQASGNTPMRECVTLMLEKYPITRGIIVSDGAATDWHNWSTTDEEHKDILDRYVAAGVPIDCVHISNGTAGEDLLRHIAKKTGGVFMKFTDVSAFQTAFAYLTPGLRGMLTNGSVTAEMLGAKEIR
jgi:hypothetical protein